MANELKTNIKISFDSDTASASWAAAEDLYSSYDTDQFRRGSQLIGTSEEEIIFDAAGIIEGNKWIWFVNRSTLYNIEIAAASGENSVIQLRPGEVAGFQELGDLVFYATATTGAAMLEFCIMGGQV
jgi:hypothetical protein